MRHNLKGDEIEAALSTVLTGIKKIFPEVLHKIDDQATTEPEPNGLAPKPAKFNHF